MPSGAKKRKAAKKKKVNQPSNTTTSASTLSLGEQDLKSIDEKSSDGDNVSSPASSQDHSIQQHPFEQQDEEVEKREDTSIVRSIVTENLQGSTVKSEEDFESQNVTIIDWKKKLHNGSSSRSSSSSSSDNDESHVLDKKVVVVETTPSVDSVNQVTDTSVKETDSSVECHEGVSVNEKVLADSSMDSGEVIESGSKENVEKKLPSLDENIELQKEEDAVVSTLNEYESAVQVNEESSLLSVNTSTLGTNNGEEHVKYTKSTDCYIEEPLIASAPRAVQTTSWKGCCGLFELFTGSSR